MTDLSIRDATPADAEAIVAILNPIIAARIYTVFDAPFSSEAERDYLTRFPARGVWKVAVRDSGQRLVGFQVDLRAAVHADPAVFVGHQQPLHI